MKSVFALAVLSSAQMSFAACADNQTSRWITEMIEARAGQGAFPAPTSGGECQASQVSGGPLSSVCSWEFDYRADAAAALMDGFVGTLQSCFDVQEIAPDQQVNHPDSYDLHQLEVGETMVSVSLKDKAALTKTYIFLRFEPAN